MSLNCNEINLVLSELNLQGAFIQDIIQPGYDTLAFYTYKEGTAKTVLICTAQNSVRINETRRKITKNPKPLRFMEFLKSKIKGCRINTCAQIGLERVIKMELSHSDEERFNMYIRLWNNAANVILCDQNDFVLDSMFRRPERYEMKGETFIPPAVIEEKLKEAEERFPVREWEGESFNSYIDYWYSEHADNLSRESLLEKAEKWYESVKSKRENALNNLLNKQEDFKNAPQLKHQGDLIMSYGHLIDGSSKYLECEDYESGKTVRLLIDPKKSAQENAAEYYKNYKKAVSGAEELEHDIQIARLQLEKLEKQYADIKAEKNPVKIEQMLRRDSTPVQKQKKTHPGLEYTVNGWLIYVGRDANENDELLRRHVRGEDLWLHVRDFAGGYVFIKAQKNKTVPLDILLDAGNLAVYYSKARNNTKVDLYYTHVKYLRRAKNGPKGLVIPTQEKNLCISPDKERLSRLDFLHEEAQL
ncbi:Putative RNA-binding protein [Treponema sp. JC4]|uniref:NFACT RNA binding domain-containing protein n=1 Tax=Treponema sp. JC4 TaxID=1124982 RepID=UPI00025B0D7F|nr:NFACT RNA binding domain-containing protein [Treponema sp. JC4]EID85981.1 Putative RNA-binding protein [Treponema sp. JC4]